MRILTFFLLFTLCTTLNAAVRWNPNLRVWEGNVCMNNMGWQIVNWQPIGSICLIQIPGRPPMQGIIINA